MTCRAFHKRCWLLLVGPLLLLATARLCFLQGLIFPVRVASGSMYSTLVGPHYLVPCADCRFSFACDATQDSPTANVACPNCGYAGNELDAKDLQPGQRVLIDRAPFTLRSPHRWELVAFQTPARQPQLQVKRVVGLPQERIEIRDGDVYCDGHILRKSIDQLRDVAICVHDQAHEPSQAGPQRWAAKESGSSGWSASGAELRHRGRATSTRQFDWITYRHRSCFSGPAAQQETPVRDNYGYNQGVSRSLHQVHDLLVRCTLEQPQGAGRMAFMAHDGQQAWLLVWTPATGKVVLKTAERTITTAAVPRLQDHVVSVEYSICDDQIIFAMGGISVLSHSYEPPDYPFQPTSRPLAIANASAP